MITYGLQEPSVCAVNSYCSCTPLEANWLTLTNVCPLKERGRVTLGVGRCVRASAITTDTPSLCCLWSPGNTQSENRIPVKSAIDLREPLIDCRPYRV